MLPLNPEKDSPFGGWVEPAVGIVANGLLTTAFPPNELKLNEEDIFPPAPPPNENEPVPLDIGWEDGGVAPGKL